MIINVLSDSVERKNMYIYINLRKSNFKLNEKIRLADLSILRVRIIHRCVQYRQYADYGINNEE